jgi:protein-disulfide isomerase
MSTQASRREALRSQQVAQAKAARNRKMVGIGAGIAAVVLAAVLIVVAVSSMGSSGVSASPKNATTAQDAVVLYGSATKAGAPTIDVYLDYQCPICKVAEATYGDTMYGLAKTGDIKLIQHTMTFMDDNLKNTASTRAAVAATCTDTYGDKYAEMTTAIFSNQALTEVVGSVGYEDKLLRETLPAQLGITGDALTGFQKCYDTKAPKSFLDTVAKNSYAAGVKGTPTFKRDGVVLNVNPASTTVDQFKSLLLTGK